MFGWVACTTPSLAAAPSNGSSAAAGDFGKMVEGTEFLKEMSLHADKIEDASYVVQILTRRDGKEVHGAAKTQYKKPALMRVEILQGRKKGTVLVSDGQKVHGYLGGLFRWMPIYLSADSKNLIADNGYCVLSSDFSSIIDLIKNDIARGAKVFVSGQPLVLTEFPEKVFVLEITEPEGEKGMVSKRLFVDAKRYLPIKWQGFRNGALFHETSWEALKVNTGLSDKLFKINVPERVGL